jgi:hypothetical protein
MHVTAGHDHTKSDQQLQACTCKESWRLMISGCEYQHDLGLHASCFVSSPGESPRLYTIAVPAVLQSLPLFLRKERRSY